MSKLEIINSHIPICPICNAGMTIHLFTESIVCNKCHTTYHIIELGRNDRDFICEVANERNRENVG